MKLVLTEKPSVAQALAKVLGANKRCDGYLEGNGYIVSWCVGHLVELSPPESLHTPLQESSKTADDGASAPHEWCGCFGCMVHSGRRHGAHGRRAFPLFGNTFALAHGFTLDLDGVGVVDDPVTDGVGQGGVVQVLVPLAGVVLGAEDGGGHLAPGLY